MLALNPVVRALIAAVVAVASAVGSGVAAATPAPLLGITAASAALIAFFGTYGYESTTVKLIVSAVVATLASVAASYTGHADLTQGILAAILAFASGLGFVASVKNTPHPAAA